jgi:L-fucose isomerase-like protein
MTKITLIHLDSGRHARGRFASDRREFLAPLRREFDLVAALPGERTAAGLEVVFIASGGCEQAFRSHYPTLAKPASQGDAGISARPVILLTDGKYNSLPAALEISGWVRQQGARAEIIHGSPRLITDRLRRLALFQHAGSLLSGRIGVIGEPSDWLIASTVDRAAVSARWGTEFVDIGLNEVTGHNDGKVEAEAIAREFIAAAESLEQVDEKAVRKAARLVPALKAVFVRHKLQAATLRCFNLIEILHTSGCLALARLNDEGLICGCEGDVPAVFSMLLLFALTGELPFMANPAAVDPESNQLILAHCTVPRRAVDCYSLQTHFETGLGVALGGNFPAGAATVFKAGGPSLGSYFVSAAEVLPAEPEPGLCRTQVRLRLQEPVDYFLKRSLANHHVLIKGDHAQLIDHFMQFYGAQRVR